MTADVVLPLPVDRSFTYHVPEDLCALAVSGCRAVVPFGSRTMTGVVVDTGEKGGDLKDVIDLPDEYPSLSDELLSLTRWIADYYLCSWGEAIRAALPSGIDIESKRRLYATRGVSGEGSDADRELLEHIAEHPGITIDRLRTVLGHGITLSRMRHLRDEGLLRMEMTVGKPKVRARTALFVAIDEDRSPEELEEQIGVLGGVRQKAVLQALLDFRSSGVMAVRQSELLKQTGATSSTIKGLLRRNLIHSSEREVIRTPLGDLAVDHVPDQPPDLHPGQIRALSALRAEIAGERFSTFLLHGVTGSGKTEVYLQALADVLARGKSGIVLVPEIALTPQTVQRFRSRLGDTVVLMHSRMSAGERYDVWRLLRSGDARVVIGPRSAVLAPLANIGLIIVDEEHEASYKQFDPAPRYHARDVAVYRARMCEAVCILGSATPSLESYRNAEIGKYALLDMPDRVPVQDAVASLPAVQIVDLGLEKRRHQLDGYLSNDLRKAIEHRLERKEQTILLQNRRGYAGILECRDCGWSPQCRDCAVTMTVHMRSRHLRCHYCGRSRRIPDRCPECGGEDLAPHGVGTQRVEEELEALFPTARILRMDLDTTRSKDAHRTILNRFRRGEAEILVGTQMVAKGLDFSRVTLVGVVNADTGLLFPDFRSAERSFQMLTQVAGRAGRNKLPGEVILQTRNPEHPVVQLASSHDYAGFVATELAERKKLGYPPYGRIIGIEFRGEDTRDVERLARSWTARLRNLPGETTVLGPEPAFIARVKRQYRYQTLIKLAPKTPPARIKRALGMILADMKRPPGALRVAIDVDPFGLY